MNEILDDFKKSFENNPYKMIKYSMVSYKIRKYAMKRGLSSIT